MQYVKELGADEAIDYKNQKFEDILHNYDAVFDTVGSETYIRSFKVLRKGGIIVSMLEQPPSDLTSGTGRRSTRISAKWTPTRQGCLEDEEKLNKKYFHKQKLCILFCFSAQF